jgi:hypothetical protein
VILGGAILTMTESARIYLQRQEAAARQPSISTPRQDLASR